MEGETSSSSEEDLTSSECDSDSSSYSQNEAFEDAKICGQPFQLPQGLCENKRIFKEFFSAQTWNSLSDSNRQHLKRFLPIFPDNDNTEKNTTVQKLFNGENIGFSNPFDVLFKHLKMGYYRPEMVRMRKFMKRIQRRESRLQQRRYLNSLIKDVVASRQWLLNTATSLPPGAIETMRLVPPSSPVKTESVMGSELRVKRRYFQELEIIRNQVGETSAWSEDENYPEGFENVFPSKSKQRRLNIPSSSTMTPPESPNVEEAIISTMTLHPFSKNQSQETLITNEIYRTLLLRHKNKRNNEKDKSKSATWEMNALKDIASRTLVTANNKKALLNLQKTLSLNSTTETKVSPAKKVIKKEQLIKPQNHRFTQITETKTNNQINTNQIIIKKESPSESELDISDTESIIDPVMSPLHNSPVTKPPALIKTSTPVTKTLNNTVTSIVSTSSIVEKSSDILNDDSILTKIVKTEPGLSVVSSTSAPTFNTITSISQYGGKIQPATLSDLEGIDMLNLPVDLDESNIGILDEITRKTPELMQDTHVSFLSLIRDIICSTPDQRMSYSTLEIRLKTWQENPISPLNDWYNLVDNWLEVLSCAVSFLNGDFPEQPEDFVPYLELKPALQEYQWIGAGRDSDSLLSQLFQYWIEHREEMVAEKTIAPVVQEIETVELPKSPPPPRWPTTWTVRRAEPGEIDIFREQERRRYENPHKAFTYRMYGYESVVGPVKGIYNQTAGVTKPRGHSMLSSDRPNFVTILTLVRDATARLPNGEGTRADICELLKSSQYIAQGASDSVLQSVVSGALDRMHTEYDPCVKYDTKRKIWIYLHRNRTESEFERIHQQHQGMSKHQKKNNSRKSKAKPKVDKASSQKQSGNEITVSNATTNIPMVTNDGSKQRFKAPISRNVTTQITTATNVVSMSTDALKTTPAGTSLLINHNKQSLINKNVLEKIQASSTTSIKILGQTVITQSLPQSLISPTVTSKNSAITTTVQTLQSIIAPRVNSPVLKPLQQISNPKTGAKSIVKIVNSPQQGKSLINMSGGQIITNQQPPQLFVKQPQTVTSSSGQVQTIIPSINIKSNQNEANLIAQISQASAQKQATIIASHPNTQILQTIVQPRQTVGTRQIIQSLTTNQPQKGQTATTLLTQGTLPQQIIQVTPGQKIGQTATLVQTKQGNKTVLTSAQQLLQNIKQVKATTGAQQTQSNISNSPQAILKQQVALQQFQKQLQQTISATSNTKTGTSLLDQNQSRIQGNKSTSSLTNTQAPLVAKVLTNASGQVISVESLLAHQKQHGSLPQGTTLRVAGGKLSQANLIQLSGAIPNQVTQFAVVSQGNLVSLTGAQPRLIASVAQQNTQTTTATTPQIIVATQSKSIPVKNARQSNIQQTGGVTKLSGTPSKVTHQLINAKFISAQNISTPKLTTTQQSNPVKQSSQQSTTKVVTATSLSKQSNKSANNPTVVNTNQATAIRMVNPTTGLNFTHIAGKPILLASKGNAIQGQNIILRQGGSGQSFVITNPSTRSTTQQTATLTSSHQNNQIVLGTPLKIQNVNDGNLVENNQNQSVDSGSNQQQQTLLLSTSSTGTSPDGSTNLPAQRVVLASQGQGGQLVAQQILLPQGFQGGTINIKTLQGLKVIPLAQQSKGLNTGRQQLFTRIVNPVAVTSTETTQPSSTKTIKIAQPTKEQ